MELIGLNVETNELSTNFEHTRIFEHEPAIAFRPFLPRIPITTQSLQIALFELNLGYLGSSCILLSHNTTL